MCEHETTKDGYCLTCGDAFSPLSILQMDYSSSLCLNPEAKFGICLLDESNICIHCGYWSGLTTHVPADEFAVNDEGDEPQELVLFGTVKGGEDAADGRRLRYESEMDYTSSSEDDDMSLDDYSDEEMAGLPDNGWAYFSPMGRRMHMEEMAAEAAEAVMGDVDEEGYDGGDEEM